MSEQRAHDFNPRKNLKNISGSAYLDVANRVMWLNSEYEHFTVDNELLHYGDDYAVVRSVVTLYDDHGAVLQRAVGHGQARRSDMKAHIASRFLEKAETAAVGRALGLLGMGTLAAQEFDDSDHLSDTPAPVRGTPPATAETPRMRTDKPVATSSTTSDVLACEECGVHIAAWQDKTARAQVGRPLCIAHLGPAIAAKNAPAKPLPPRNADEDARQKLGLDEEEAPAAQPLSPGVTEAQLRMLRAHLARTGQDEVTVCEDLDVARLENLTRERATTLIQQQNAAKQPTAPQPVA